MLKTTDSNLPQVDVEIVLEGSYPYVTGGVSSWTHQLIEGMPDIRFGLVHLASSPEDTAELKYKLPPNVLYLHNIFIHDPVFLEVKHAGKDFGIDKNKFFHGLYQLHICARDRRPSQFRSIIEKLCSEYAIPHMREFFYSEKAFALLLSLYQKGFENSSFIDFFWTWRYMHIPIFQIFQARKGPARLVHSACTGYAGFYAATRKIAENLPLLLTEHGIYTRERAIEILKSEAIYQENVEQHKVAKDLGVFKQIWLSFFEVLGLWAYQMSDRIYTLYEGNRQAQISLGAEYDKIEIVPNGIIPEKYLNLRPFQLPDPDAIQIGFVGRIVSIKDVKTLLRAFKIVQLSSEKAQLHLVGPLEEEPEYVAAMRNLANDLGVEKQVFFHGTQDVTRFYPRLDICVLTSISEGQPLTILEAMAAGIPIVATDVGGCGELINGRTFEDKKLGACGILTNLASPGETAAAILKICREPQTYQSFVEAGIARVKAFYSQQKVVQKYYDDYRAFLETSPVRPG
ncbi:MAG: GT4 family glycosyltransferase PelF [Candidatus Rifleibacteriota bacterium]